jgi:hypothetical protein
LFCLQLKDNSAQKLKVNANKKFSKNKAVLNVLALVNKGLGLLKNTADIQRKPKAEIMNVQTR